MSFFFLLLSRVTGVLVIIMSLNVLAYSVFAREIVFSTVVACSTIIIIIFCSRTTRIRPNDIGPKPILYSSSPFAINYYFWPTTWCKHDTARGGREGTYICTTRTIDCAQTQITKYYLYIVYSNNIKSLDLCLTL